MNREQTVVLSFYLPQKGSKLAHTETLSLLPPPKLKKIYSLLQSFLKSMLHNIAAGVHGQCQDSQIVGGGPFGDVARNVQHDAVT
jgi:hypothetical protein